MIQLFMNFHWVSPALGSWIKLKYYKNKQVLKSCSKAMVLTATKARLFWLSTVLIFFCNQVSKISRKYYQSTLRPFAVNVMSILETYYLSLVKVQLCTVVGCCHLVRSKSRPTESGTLQTTIVRCFFSFQAVVQSENLIVFKTKQSLPKTMTIWFMLGSNNSNLRILYSCLIIKQCRGWCILQVYHCS